MTTPQHLRLFGRRLCPYSRRVSAYITERGLDIERVAFEPARHATALRALNPKMTVPTLQLDETFAIFESLIMMEFLEDQGGDEPLMPIGPRDRARTRLLYDLADHRMGVPMRDFVRAPLDDPGRAGHARALAHVALDALPLLSHEGPFALGAGFTLADLSVPPLVLRAVEAGFEADALPQRVYSWCSAVLARSSVREQFPDVALGS